MKIRYTFVLIVSLAFVSTGFTRKDPGLPNILWITSEDNSRLLGCYGDKFATTPHLDQLAAEGFLYTNAYANGWKSIHGMSSVIAGVPSFEEAFTSSMGRN